MPQKTETDSLFANKRIFLAGASGAIGRQLAPLLIADGWRVAGTTRSADKAPLLREALVRHMRKRYPSIVVLDTPADPPAGALWNARHRFTRAAQTAVTAL